MNFSEQPPSEEWAVLKYRGEKIAEVWLKPEGEPFALLFRVPQKSFRIPNMDQLLTTENLLTAVGIAKEEVESWHHEGIAAAGVEGANLELGHSLPPPPQDVAHLHICVQLKPPAQAGASVESGEAEFLEAKWQDLEARWKAIETLEVTLDNLRLRVESVRTEMETSSRRMLSMEEKLHAFNADVAQWNKAKTRVLYTLPKAKEFIHRATWAVGTPERKQLEAYFKDQERPSLSLAQMQKVREQLENLLKDRQVLSAQGVTVCQECQGVAADVQTALRTLQSNAVSNANKKRSADRAKGKFI